jgi:hypothetical protein
VGAAENHDGWVLHQSGPPDADHTVLLLPGALCTDAFYEDLIADPLLSGPSIRLVSTTLPGYGRTPRPEDRRQTGYQGCGQARRSARRQRAAPSVPASPAARWRSSRSSPRGSPTHRSQSALSSASTRSTVTSRTSTRSSGSHPEPRPPPWPPSATFSPERRRPARTRGGPPGRPRATPKDGPIGR